MNLTNLAGFIIVLICAALMGVFWYLNRGRPYRGLRPIPAFGRLRRAIGMAVEDGSRVHVSLGSASLTGANSASALIGLAMLERVAQLGSASDRPPVVTAGDPSLAILSQDELRSTYRAANLSEEYNPQQGRLAGVTPFSYAAGTMPVFFDEQVSSNIVIGNFGPEAGLIADAAEQTHACLLAGSDALTGQAVLFAAAQDPLIGEELFAGGAYLQAGSMHTASLHTQDALRWGLAGLMILGAILKLIGVV
ncbi:MAG TPA: DUF6754 domain-containing protein [Anaerolineaceae bacterium]